MSAYRMIGFFMIAISLGMWINSLLKIRRCSQSAVGEIVSREERQEMTSGRTWRSYYCPVCSYEVDGVTYTSTGKSFSRRPGAFQLKDKCTVKYNPQDPGECLINGKTGAGFFEIVLLAWGVLFAFIG